MEKSTPQGEDAPGPDNGTSIPPPVENKGVITPPPTGDIGIHAQVPNPDGPGFGVWRSQQPKSFGFRHLPRDEGMGEKKTKGALWLNPRPSVSAFASRIVRIMESSGASPSIMRART